MTNYGSLYKTYEKKFYEAKRHSKERYLPFMGEKYDMNAFKAFFEATKAAIIEEGRTPSNTQVIKEMIDRQQFVSGEKEGKALQKAMQARGFNITLEQAKAYKGFWADADAIETFYQLPAAQRKNAAEVKKFFEEIDTFYNEQRALGKSAEEIKRLISNVYFGSL